MPHTQTPVRLSRGAHSPDGEYCLMEHVSVRAGLPWSDHPECTHQVLGSAARRINDMLGDDERQELLQLEDDLLACPPVPGLEPRLSIQLAVWSAEQVLALYEAKHPDDQRPRKAIEAAKAWLAEPTEEHRQAAAYASAAAAAYAYAAAAYAYAAAAAYAYAAAAAAYAYAAAAYASAAAAAAAYAAAAGARSSAAAIPGPVDLLRGLIGRYRKLAAADAMRSEPAAGT